MHGAGADLSRLPNAAVAQPVNFDWSNVANATSYEIHVDDCYENSAGGDGC